MNPTTKRPNVDFGSTDLVYHKNVFHLFLTRIFHLQIKFEGIIWQFIFNHWCPAVNSLPDLSVYFQQTSEKRKKKWQGFCFFSISNFLHVFYRFSAPPKTFSIFCLLSHNPLLPLPCVLVCLLHLPNKSPDMKLPSRQRLMSEKFHLLEYSHQLSPNSKGKVVLESREPVRSGAGIVLLGFRLSFCKDKYP